MYIWLDRTIVPYWRGHVIRKVTSVSWVSWWHSFSTTMTYIGGRGSTATGRETTLALLSGTTKCGMFHVTCCYHLPASVVSDGTIFGTKNHFRG